jgi:hypothetical protein
MTMLRKGLVVVGLSAMSLGSANCIHVRTTTRDPSKTVKVRAPFAKVDVEVPEDEDDGGADVHLDMGFEH